MTPSGTQNGPFWRIPDTSQPTGTGLHNERT